ncbi:MAG: hypothetical protein AABY22_30630 [Nanoarchaeota archaeon]
MNEIQTLEIYTFRLDENKLSLLEDQIELSISRDVGGDTTSIHLGSHLIFNPDSINFIVQFKIIIL